MRPRGSRNGRLPPGGYPALKPDAGSFLAGFIEGEACFSVVPQSRRYGYRCAMTINVRQDDRAFLEQLSVDTRLGGITEVKARATSRAQVRWTIAAKSDCMRLARILEAAPLRGRKSADFALWHDAVSAWIGEDATARRSSGSWDDLEYLAGRLKHVKRYGAAAPPTVTDPAGLEPDWAPYLAGFLTAEGYFGIARANADRLRPIMRVNARADDRPLLEQLAWRTGAGRTYAYPRKSYEASPVANWTVCSRVDLERLVTLLDRTPPAGKKGREYAIWRDGVDALSLPMAARQTRLHELRDELSRVREYGPSP